MTTNGNKKKEDLPGISLTDPEQMREKQAGRFGYPDLDHCLATQDPEMEELDKQAEVIKNDIINYERSKSGWSGPATRESSKFHDKREKKAIKAVIQREWGALTDKNNIPNCTKLSNSNIVGQKACNLIQPYDNGFRDRLEDVTNLFNRSGLMLGYHENENDINLPPEKIEILKNNFQKVEILCESLADDIKKTLVRLKIHNIGFFPGM